jgi:holo-[acyl-carrier protein] synthase
VVVDSAVIVIGVGIDLVDLAGVTRLLERKAERALQRLFTETEREYLTRGPNPTGHAAARIAAKEAVYKAMQSIPGARAIGWREIEVTRDAEGRPAILLHGLAARLAEQQGGVHIQVSLTHSSLSAGAVAVISAPAPPAPSSPTRPT